MSSNKIISVEFLVDYICKQRQPLVIGIAGGVAVGKTTFAKQLSELLIASSITAQVVSTDNFLKSNSELEQENLIEVKGWPETYHLDRLLTLITDFKFCNKQEYTIPFYCHKRYDLLDNNYLHFTQTSVLIIEGVVALNSKIAPAIDYGIYLDADNQSARAWFQSRCLGLIKQSIGDPTSFYHKWSAWDEEKVIPVLHKCWDEVNLKNLQQNILATKEVADLIIAKDASHNLIVFEDKRHA